MILFFQDNTYQNNRHKILYLNFANSYCRLSSLLLYNDWMEFCFASSHCYLSNVIDFTTSLCLWSGIASRNLHIRLRFLKDATCPHTQQTLLESFCWKLCCQETLKNSTLQISCSAKIISNFTAVLFSWCFSLLLWNNLGVTQFFF